MQKTKMRRKDPAKEKRFCHNFVSLELYVDALNLVELRSKLWRDFISLVSCNKEFTPDKYDSEKEPPRYDFDSENTEKIYKLLLTGRQTVLFEKYNPYYMFYTIDSGSINAAGPDNYESISIEEQYFLELENIERLITYSKRLYKLFSSIYANIAHDEDMDRQNTIYTYYRAGHPREGKWRSMEGFGGDIRKGIPGVYWANFFSKVYVEEIGKKKFRTAPCHKRYELFDGGFLLLTSESPLDWQKPEVQELRRAMRDHLGYEYFCDIENQERKCKVPKFDFSAWEKECEYGMKIPDRLKL